MLNHKGFTLIETLIAILIITAGMRLVITYQVQFNEVNTYQKQEKIGIYYAEHIQSMILLEIAPFNESIVDVTIHLNGEVDPHGHIHVYVFERYLTLTDQVTGQIIFEGAI
jgi:prepilin-type N-terminal cleavage/methylation domain-containing protein